jgi:hypothetical protein
MAATTSGLLRYLLPMRHPGVNRGQFFEKLHDIFPLSIGPSNAEPEANMMEVAYQASCPRNDPPRAAGRKENLNPQHGKRKTTTDEPSPMIAGDQASARSQIGKWQYARPS